MKKYIYIENLGCAKNIVDSERLLGAFVRNNYSFTKAPEEANVIIINTCSFLEASREESIDTIFYFNELKEHNLETLIVTGCLVESNGAELQQMMPEIDYVVNNRDLDRLFDTLRLKKEESEFYYTNRHLMDKSGYAYLKVSEGCNRRCSFCTIPLFKGGLISRPIRPLVEEAKTLVANQRVKELILVAQDLTDYGKDIRTSLHSLLKELIKMDDLRWIRLLYTYPTSIDDELINLISDSNKICSYIDIPFQHFDNDVLSLMNRQGSKEEYVGLIDRLRDRISELSIRSTFIVGFPGETEQAFQNLYDTLEQVKLDRVGVFSYSYEEDTTSSKLPNHIPDEVRELRREKIMKLQEKISEEKLSKRIGKTYDVLIEDEVYSENKNELPYFIARSQFEAPDVDGNIILKERNLEVGSMYKAEILTAYEHDMIGRTTQS